jgi:hypothetical protein
MLHPQANYAAANAAMDAGMCARRVMGGIGVSVQWGPWALTNGMASDITLQFAQERGSIIISTYPSIHYPSIHPSIIIHPSSHYYPSVHPSIHPSIHPFFAYIHQDGRRGQISPSHLAQ